MICFKYSMTYEATIDLAICGFKKEGSKSNENSDRGVTGRLFYCSIIRAGRIPSHLLKSITG